MNGEEEQAKRPVHIPLDTFVVSARVTASMLEAIEEVLDSGLYLRLSDYLRDVIRKDLQSRGIIID